ncbi:MAG: DUF2283 domain-containing protein [Anaerolineae bacterium]|nr:DUF2283 domain-containing protein [Anaerolineae bacterium]
MAIFYDEQGKIVGIEIEDASHLVDAPNRVDFECYTQVSKNRTKQRSILIGTILQDVRT